MFPLCSIMKAIKSTMAGLGERIKAQGSRDAARTDFLCSGAVSRSWVQGQQDIICPRPPSADALGATLPEPSPMSTGSLSSGAKVSGIILVQKSYGTGPGLASPGMLCLNITRTDTNILELMPNEPSHMATWFHVIWSHNFIWPLDLVSLVEVGCLTSLCED